MMDSFVKNIVDASIYNSNNPLTLYKPAPNDQKNSTIHSWFMNQNCLAQLTNLLE